MLRIVLVFLRTRPLTTIAIIVLSIFSRVLNVLAFFLPLKVVLLAGSDGVPHYFRMLVDSGDKNDWLVWLSAAAVACYLLTVLFDSLSERLAASSSMDVLEGANEMAVTGKERAEAHSFYYRFSEVMADSVFTLIVMAGLVFINPLLLGVLVAVFLLQWFAVALVMNAGDPLHPGRIQTALRDNRRGFLQGLVSVDFLIGFFVILAPFLLGQEANILLAILSIFIVRRGLASLSAAIGNSINLYAIRYRVDPLVFRKRRSMEKEPDVFRAVRALFGKKQREKLARRLLPKATGKSLIEVSAFWEDSRINGAHTLHFMGRVADESEPRHYQYQVYAQGNVHLLDREELLFSKVSRRALNAPEVFVRDSIAGFESQLCDYGVGETLGHAKWQQWLPTLLRNLWAFQPPRELIEAYDSAHPMLHRRLTADLVERIGVGVDSAEDEEVYGALVARLPAIHQRLRQMPVHVYNPDLGPGIIVPHPDTGYRIMTWVRWAIEPVGFGPHVNVARPELVEEIEEVNRRRPVRKPLTPERVKFVNDCFHLEREILRRDYKAALMRAKEQLKVGDSAAWS